VLRACFYYLLFFPWTFVSILLALLSARLGGPNAAHRVGIIWGRSCLRLAGLKLTVTGAENIPPTGPAIYVSNHQSNFDIPIFYAGLPIQFRWLAKQELFKVPLFGTAMKYCGYIPIDRSNRRKAMESLNLAAQRIKDGASVIIFPEGTRTADGRLQEFKKGALILAAKARVPVVPVTIKGSFRVQSKDSLKITPGPLELIISPPLATEHLHNRDIDPLTRQIHDCIAANLQGAQ